MDSAVKRIINELEVVVRKDSTLKKDAYYFPSINMIVINSRLSEFEQLKSLLHELGHACKHHKDYFLYNIAFSLHSKMEHEADCYMIEKLLDDYLLKTELDPHQVNYMKFIEDTNLDPCYESLVKNMLLERACLYETT